MIIQFIKGKDGISHDDHDTIVERFHADVVNQRRHQVKGMMKQEVIGTTVTTQTRTQACCLR